jgi:hypothetical protein
MRVILCTVSDDGSTFTFTERDFSGQAPGPYDEKTAPDYAATEVQWSITGAKNALGTILNSEHILGGRAQE